MVRHRAEQAVKAQRISTAERREILEAYSAGIQGYTTSKMAGHQGKPRNPRSLRFALRLRRRSRVGG